MKELYGKGENTMKKQNKLLTILHKWKTVSLIVTAVLLTWFAGVANAQQSGSASSSVVVKNQDIRAKVAGKDSTVIRTQIERFSDDRPMLGVYLDDLDFETAYKMHYDYTHGVLVDGVVSDGAAQRAGIMENDIIMEFDGEKVRHEDHMVRLIQSKNIGDNVQVKYFRDGKVNTVSVILQGRNGEEVSKEEGRHVSAGDGGFTFYATWYEPDHAEISDLLNRSGFSDVLTDNPFGDSATKGLLMRGFQFQFEDDNNWYWGFDFNSAKVDRRSSGDTDRRMEYEFGYWGFMLQKRIPVFNFLILDGGFTAGTGSYDIKLYEVNKDYNWDDLDGDMNTAVNHFVHLKKNYLLAHPNASVIVRFTDWIGLRGNVGYMLGYSYHTRWNAKVVSDNIEVKSSPETKVDGLTYSVGLWFDIF